MSADAGFDEALSRHLDAIADRDLAAFKASVTTGPTLFTIVQNGHAFTTPTELIALHEEWFEDPDWIWEGEVVRKIVGEDMGFAVIKYDYRARPEDRPMTTWLTFVFMIEDGEWRLVHDQNTLVDPELELGAE